MPRTERIDVGGEVYHVINRANGRHTIFRDKEDYQLFESLLADAKELTGMRILAYTIMPNHWHLLLEPRKDGDLALFMHWLSTTHTRRVHVRTKTVGGGHLYQGRYKSFIVDSDQYLLTLIKYIERNPVRAKLVRSCENWQWGSAWRRGNGDKKQKKLIDPSPATLPHGYSKWINTPETATELELVRTSVIKGVPYGGEKWVDKMVTKYHLESTLKSPGRPKKK